MKNEWLWSFEFGPSKWVLLLKFAKTPLNKHPLSNWMSWMNFSYDFTSFSHSVTQFARQNINLGYLRNRLVKLNIIFSIKSSTDIYTYLHKAHFELFTCLLIMFLVRVRNDVLWFLISKTYIACQKKSVKFVLLMFKKNHFFRTGHQNSFFY